LERLFHIQDGRLTKISFLKNVCQLSILLLVLFAHANAQYTVQYFIERAKANSPSIHVLQNDQRSNKLQAQRSDAENSAPHLSLTADYLFAPFFNNNKLYVSSNPNFDATGYDIGITNGGLYSAQLNLEKSILNFAAAGALEKTIQADDKTAEQGLKVEQHAITKQVIDLFLATQQAQQLLNVSTDILVRLNDQLKISGELVKAGLLKQTDYLLLQIEVQNQTMQVSQLQSEFKGDLNSLFSACGMTDTILVQLEPMSEGMEQETDNTQFMKTFEYDSMKTVAEQEVFESKYAPQMKVFFNTGLNAVEWENIGRKYGFSAGFNFSLPLYDGGQKSLIRQQYELSLENIAFKKKYFLLQWNNQRKNLKEQIRMQKENILLVEKQLSEFKDVLDISTRNMQRGNLLMVEYLALLKNYSDVRKNEIQSRINYLQLINNYNYWCW
jgi:outer membrane protein TolC